MEMVTTKSFAQLPTPAVTACLLLLVCLMQYTTLVHGGFVVNKSLFVPTKKHILQPLYNKRNNRFDRDLEEDAERKALQKTGGRGGVGETAAGAILGGLVLGPFGALFGASIGSKFGQGKALDTAKQEELARMGITQEMLESTREIGIALERSIEGLEATQASLKTQQNFAKRLEFDIEKTITDATKALADEDEVSARGLLLKKNQIQEKLKKTLLSCVEEKKRLMQMEENVRAIEERAIEMESLLNRNIGAKSLLDTSTQFSLADEDPLLQKFRDMGLD